VKVAISTVGKYHAFDLARQLEQRDMLACVYTGYPRFKLAQEGLPQGLLRPFPFIQMICLLCVKLGIRAGWMNRQMAWISHRALDMYSSSGLPKCDAFIGLSGVGLITGTKVQQRGGVYVCDRGSTHLRYQDRLIRDEYQRYGLPFNENSEQKIAEEEAEYERADAITVPSSFSRRSFVEMGIPASKVHQIPYGVDFSRFSKVGQPSPDRFDVLFVDQFCIRKGARYLLEGFKNLDHPNKCLTLAGAIAPEVKPILAKYAAAMPVKILGHVPHVKLKEIMSRSHVLVLPSVEDGFGLVLAEAMACGCPIIASENTGAPDLIRDGCEGYIVPVRESESISDRLQTLADNPALRNQMSDAAITTIRRTDGWKRYGDAMVELLEVLLRANRGRLEVAAENT
jgi:glycosyltransferase involved in cell wall biosynthesis